LSAVVSREIFDYGFAHVTVAMKAGETEQAHRELARRKTRKAGRTQLPPAPVHFAVATADFTSALIQSAQIQGRERFQQTMHSHPRAPDRATQVHQQPGNLGNL